MSEWQFGVIGLGVMGRNLALNIESRGYSVLGFDLAEQQREAARKRFDGGNLSVADSMEEFVKKLELPRRILLMVPAGAPVDAAIAQLRPLLAKGDILIDGGNSYFHDTERRANELAPTGLHFFGMGVSGGEEGALKGPAIMPGGDETAYKVVEPVLTAIAAKTDEGACCTYIGPRGAGHYVKMVHNGIEYGVMQLICEAYDLLKSKLNLSAKEFHQLFEEWDNGPLGSYLIEITSQIFTVRDNETGKPVVDIILDKAGQKGTGKWTSQNALDLGVSTPTINAAVEARILSAFLDERRVASKMANWQNGSSSGDREKIITNVRDGLYLAIITSYAQGFALMREASKEYDYSLDMAEIARIWKGGCIIRAKLLDLIRKAYKANADLPNLLVDKDFSNIVGSHRANLATVVSMATTSGVPALGLSASLAYIDGYHRERMPANLLQAQRDFFGAHTYKRIDRPEEESFHTIWPELEE